MTEPVSEPFGTETAPEAPEPAPPAETEGEPEPAADEETAAPETAQHAPATTPPAVPDGQPFWLAEAFQSLHDRIVWLEKALRGR